MRLGVAKTITTIAADTTTTTTTTTITISTPPKRSTTTTSRMSHHQPQRLAIVLALAVLACLGGTPVTHAARRSRIDQATATPLAATTPNGVDNAAIKDDQQQPAAAAPLPLIGSLKEPATDQSSEADAAAVAAAISAPVDGDDAKGLLDATDIQTARAQPAAQVSALEDSSADVSASVSSTKQSGEQLTAAAAVAASGEPKEAVSSDLSSGEDVDLELVQHDQLNGQQSSSNNNNGEYCDPDMTGFEIITGYVFSAPDKLLDSLPGTLMLTDCLEACQNNETCHAVNYETGLCVLFSSNADRLPGALTKSQFPVFTIYAQKSCLGVRPCARAWCVDRVQNYKLKGLPKRSVPVTSRRDCLELCLGETEFTCRSANYHRASNTCDLSEMDRITLAGSSAFQPFDGIDYLENNCAEEPNKLCEFKRLSGRILKTVDSVYQDVGSIDECRDLCLNSPYRCHSYDYGDTGDMVCRLSHHSRSTLSDVQDPYLEVPEAATYELSSCYNVTIECGAGDMIARIRTSKLFDGKVYAKGSPKSCAIDVKSALDFELRMGYNDLECNVRQSGSGRYMNDVVIQHHDTIVTSSDLGLAVTCQYDLTNKSVTNDVDLGVKGDIEPALSEEVIVDSPNVIMKITSRDGSDVMRSAEVGDPLALKFEIIDEQSPYEIFVRELVAMDGADNAEITLIDSRGCPTDHFIMGPIYKSSLSGKVLLSHFDAFKFPSSEVVQFRALVTPCMPSCEPVQCDQDDIGGEFKSLSSYGRRRRSLSSLEAGVAGHDKSMWLFTSSKLNNGHGQQHQQQQVTRSRRETTNNSNKQPSQEDLLLVQSIQITDKFGFDKQQQQQPNQKGGSVYETNETVFVSGEPTQGFCVNAIGLVVAGTVFLLAQLAVISIWTYIYQRRRKQQPYAQEAALSNASSAYGSHSGSGGSGSTVMSGAPSGRTESLCKLYDGGFGGRHGRQF